MLTSAAVKKYWKEQHGLNVRVSTTPTKQRWVTARMTLVNERYTGEFPLDTRIDALKIIYPGKPNLWEGGSAGNVCSHMISMVESEWEEFFNLRAAKAAESPSIQPQPA